MENLTDPKFLLGLVSNLTTLYLVLTKSRKELHEYKKLLMIFLLTDLIYTILQDILRPIFVVHKDLFIIILPGEIDNKIFLSIYCGFVSMSFVIFASHFVYRAVSISGESISVIRLTIRRLTIIISIFAGECCLWTYICQRFLNYEDSYQTSTEQLYVDIGIEFPDDPYHSILIFRRYRSDGSFYTEKFLAVMAMMAIVAITFLAIIVSSTFIVRTLLRSGNRSNTWRKHHKQLFTALLVQISIPYVLLYLPCSFFLLSPFLNSDLIHTPTWFLTTLYSIYPILDPLAIILMISDYRKALLNMLRVKTQEVSSGTATSHNMAPITAVEIIR